MSMLRHKPTGDLYIRTELLAARADMDPVDEPIADEPVAEAPKKDKKDKKKPKVVSEPVAEPEPVADLEQELTSLFEGE